jgi:hypothetical protein
MAMDCIFDLLDAAAKDFPIKALADEVEKAESTLRNELNRQPGYKLGLHTAYLIMKKTGDLRALDEIETMLGRVAFSLPEADGNVADLMETMGRAVKEFGEYVTEMGRTLADGYIREDEAEKCLKELWDTMRILVKLKAYLEQRLKV